MDTPRTAALACNETLKLALALALKPPAVAAAGTEFATGNAAGPLTLTASVPTGGLLPRPGSGMTALETVATWPSLLFGGAPVPINEPGARVHPASAGLALVATACVKAVGMAFPSAAPSGRTTGATWAIREHRSPDVGVLADYKARCEGRPMQSAGVTVYLRDDDALQEYKHTVVLPSTPTYFAVAGAPEGCAARRLGQWTEGAGGEPPPKHWLPGGVSWTRVPAAVAGPVPTWVGTRPDGSVPTDRIHHAPSRWYFGQAGREETLHPSTRLVSLFPHMAAIYTAAKAAAAGLEGLVVVSPWHAGIAVTARVPVAVSNAKPTPDTATFTLTMASLRNAATRVTGAVVGRLAPGELATLKDLAASTVGELAWDLARAYPTAVTHGAVYGGYPASRGWRVRSNTCACSGCLLTGIMKTLSSRLCSTSRVPEAKWMDTACAGAPVVLDPSPPRLHTARARASRKRTPATAPPSPPVRFVGWFPRPVQSPTPPPVRRGLFPHALGAGAAVACRDEDSRGATTVTLEDVEERPSPNQRQVTSFFAAIGHASVKTGVNTGHKRSPGACGGASGGKRVRR